MVLVSRRKLSEQDFACSSFQYRRNSLLLYSSASEQYDRYLAINVVAVSWYFWSTSSPGKSPVPTATGGMTTFERADCAWPIIMPRNYSSSTATVWILSPPSQAGVRPSFASAGLPAILGISFTRAGNG